MGHAIRPALQPGSSTLVGEFSPTGVFRVILPQGAFW
jgi:hypothetical protein